MSFKCQKCGEAFPDKVKPIRIITKTRKKVYPVRYDKKDPKIVIDNGGNGWEIVEEKMVCVDCANPPAI